MTLVPGGSFRTDLFAFFAGKMMQNSAWQLFEIYLELFVVRQKGIFVQMFRNLLPSGQPPVSHILPPFVVIPPAGFVKCFLDL